MVIVIYCAWTCICSPRRSCSYFRCSNIHISTCSKCAICIYLNISAATSSSYNLTNYSVCIELCISCFNLRLMILNNLANCESGLSSNISKAQNRFGCNFFASIKSRAWYTINTEHINIFILHIDSTSTSSKVCPM